MNEEREENEENKENEERAERAERGGEREGTGEGTGEGTAQRKSGRKGAGGGREPVTEGQGGGDQGGGGVAYSLLRYLSYVAYMPFFFRGPSITFIEFHKRVITAASGAGGGTATTTANWGKKKGEGRMKKGDVRRVGGNGEQCEPCIETTTTTTKTRTKSRTKIPSTVPSTFASRFYGYDGVAYMILRTLVSVMCINAAVHFFYYPTLLFIGLDDILQPVEWFVYRYALNKPFTKLIHAA